MRSDKRPDSAWLHISLITISDGVDRCGWGCRLSPYGVSQYSLFFFCTDDSHFLNQQQKRVFHTVHLPYSDFLHMIQAVKAQCVKKIKSAQTSLLVDAC